ncbi:hypothetical protein F8S13_22700 [Chloroflexia bacterium SDU3-3]|nr:hypothetical protein F8S13_22700 [Chloroflexia bacterium SDU3-3]
MLKTYRVVVWFVVWRLGLWLAGAASLWASQPLNALGQRLSWNGTAFAPADGLRCALATCWTVWDGDYYKAIALHGYTFQGVTWPSISFFPLYPLLIRLLLPLFGGSAALAALFVSHVALLAALLLLHRLLIADFGERVADRSIWMLLLFPMSMFFAAGYTESLALALVVLLVWAIRGQRWWLAGAAGFFLALARLPGVLAAPILLYAYLDHVGWRWRALRWPALASLLPPLGLALFMAYQWRRFGTPWAFLIAQRQWEQQLSPPWVIPLTLIQRLGEQPLAIYGLHLAFWLLGIALAATVCLRMPRIYQLVLLIWLPAFLASWAFSLGRHMLVGFPAFVALALWAEVRWVRWLLVALLLPLLLICTALFVNTFWVA